MKGALNRGLLVYLEKQATVWAVKWKPSFGLTFELSPRSSQGTEALQQEELVPQASTAKEIFQVDIMHLERGVTFFRPIFAQYPSAREMYY